MYPPPKPTCNNPIAWYKQTDNRRISYASHPYDTISPWLVKSRTHRPSSIFAFPAYRRRAASPPQHYHWPTPTTSPTPRHRSSQLCRLFQPPQTPSPNTVPYARLMSCWWTLSDVGWIRAGLRYRPRYVRMGPSPNSRGHDRVRWDSAKFAREKKIQHFRKWFLNSMSGNFAKIDTKCEMWK